jgi:hypothetical protein
MYCTEPMYDSLEQAVQAHQLEQRRLYGSNFQSISAREVAAGINRERHQESTTPSPNGLYFGSAPHDEPMAQILDRLEAERAAFKEAQRIAADKARRPHTPKAEWETRSWSSSGLWHLTQTVETPIEPPAMQISCTITGQQYDLVKILDDGSALGLAGGDEHLLPKGSWQ